MAGEMTGDGVEKDPGNDFLGIIAENLSTIRKIDTSMDRIMDRIISNTKVAVMNVWEINKEFTSIGIDNIDNELRRLGLL